MAITVNCPACNLPHTAPDEYLGRAHECQACGTTMLLEQPPRKTKFFAFPQPPADKPLPPAFEKPPEIPAMRVQIVSIDISTENMIEILFKALPAVVFVAIIVGIVLSIGGVILGVCLGVLSH